MKNRQSSVACLPIVFEIAAQLAATESDDRIGAADCPEHPGLLEATADDSLTAGLHSWDWRCRQARVRLMHSWRPRPARQPPPRAYRLAHKGRPAQWSSPKMRASNSCSGCASADPELSLAGRSDCPDDTNRHCRQECGKSRNMSHTRRRPLARWSQNGLSRIVNAGGIFRDTTSRSQAKGLCPRKYPIQRIYWRASRRKRRFLSIPSSRGRPADAALVPAAPDRAPDERHCIPRALHRRTTHFQPTRFKLSFVPAGAIHAVIGCMF
jgi:hypothetical protein